MTNNLLFSGLLTTIQVLLIEDNAGDARLIRELLSEAKTATFEMQHADRLSSGLERLTAGGIDAVLLDLSLPDSQGLETLEALRSQERDVPVLVLTGLDDERTGLEAVRRGAQEYLIKGQTQAALLIRAISYAVERHKMLDIVQQMAISDGVTGLKNRRELDRVLALEVARFQRYQNPVSLLMIDVDRFKVVNDRHGHQIGDEVLRWIGKLLQGSVREIDTVARYGGEEIAIILPEIAPAEAITVAERLRKSVIDSPFAATAALGSRRMVRVEVTISLGVAGPDSTLQTVEAVIAAADSALYNAKRNGRNRTVLFDPHQHTTLPLTTGSLGTVVT